jgi:3'-5' exonuclease
MIAQLYLDIETIPAQRPDVLEEIRAAEADSLIAALDAVRPPGNYKKQETIDEWMATEAPKIKQKLIDDSAAKVEEAYRKTGLDGSFGHIACVSFAYLDAEPIKMWMDDWQRPDAERDVLMHLSDMLNERIPQNMHRVVQVVGHNVAGFDLRFLVQRSIIHGVRPHHIIGAASQAKPWETEKVYDTMIQWAGVGKTVSLDKLCKALGMPGKGDMDGSKVWDAIKAGRIAEVAEYCADDVRKVRAVHQRMTFVTAPVQQFEDVAA